MRYRLEETWQDKHSIGSIRILDRDGEVICEGRINTCYGQDYWDFKPVCTPSPVEYLRQNPSSWDMVYFKAQCVMAGIMCEEFDELIERGVV